MFKLVCEILKKKMIKKEETFSKWKLKQKKKNIENKTEANDICIKVGVKENNN